jgi:hypothetical protein
VDQYITNNNASVNANLSSSSGNLSFNATSGNLTVTTAQTGNTNNLTLVAAQSLTTSGPLSGGNVSLLGVNIAQSGNLLANRQVNITATNNLTTNGTVTAQSANINATNEMQITNATLTSTSGDLILTTAKGNISIGNSNITNTGMGNITIVASTQSATGSSTGGNVIATSQNQLSNVNGTTSIYTGSVNGTQNLYLIDKSLSSLNIGGSTSNVAGNSTYGNVSVTLATPTHVYFRDNLALNFTLNNSTTNISTTDAIAASSATSQLDTYVGSQALNGQSFTSQTNSGTFTLNNANALALFQFTGSNLIYQSGTLTSGSYRFTSNSATSNGISMHLNGVATLNVTSGSSSTPTNPSNPSPNSIINNIVTPTSPVRTVTMNTNNQDNNFALQSAEDDSEMCTQNDENCHCEEFANKDNQYKSDMEICYSLKKE